MLRWGRCGGYKRHSSNHLQLELYCLFVHLDQCSYSISIDSWFAWPCCRGLWAMLKATRCPFILSCACRLIFSWAHNQWKHTHRKPFPLLTLADAHTQVECSHREMETHTHTQTYTWCSATSPFPGLPNGRMASSSHLCLIHLLLPKLHMRVSMSAEYYFCDVMYYSCTSYFSCTEQKIVVWTNTLFQEAEAAFAGRLCDYNSWDRGRWDFNRWNKTYYKARERVWKCVS